jgi:uncharacterized protein
MHYLLFYKFVSDYVTRRAPFRTAHLLAAWKAQERGELILAGAYADPVDGAALMDHSGWEGGDGSCAALRRATHAKP